MWRASKVPIESYSLLLIPVPTTRTIRRVSLSTSGLSNILLVLSSSSPPALHPSSSRGIRQQLPNHSSNHFQALNSILPPMNAAAAASSHHLRSTKPPADLGTTEKGWMWSVGTRNMPQNPTICDPWTCEFVGFSKIGTIQTRWLASTSFSTSCSGDGSTGDHREILVQHLLVKENDVKLLLELQKRITQGDDMSNLAVDYSICPSKKEGGMLGWVRRGQMVPEFEEAAFNAPVNKVVKCKTNFGWHLLQVLSEREELVLEDIQPHHLHEKLQDPTFLGEAQLIDVREPYEVAQASLPGFQVLPLRQFGIWGPEVMANFDPEKDIYVLCHHGVRSLQVAQWLQTQGFKKVFNVSGGIHAYALKVDPSISTY